jgi:hypothetical protein
MITWVGALVWGLGSLFLGFWGAPSLLITLLGALAGYVWKGLAVEIASDTGIWKVQAEQFSKLSLSSVQVLPIESRYAIAYSLVTFVGVSLLSIVLLFLACYAFKIHLKSPRTWYGTLISFLFGFGIGFVYVGVLGLTLKAFGFHIPVADYPLLQYFFSVLINVLA